MKKRLLQIFFSNLLLISSLLGMLQNVVVNAEITTRDNAGTIYTVLERDSKVNIDSNFSECSYYPNNADSNLKDRTYCKKKDSKKDCKSISGFQTSVISFQDYCMINKDQYNLVKAYTDQQNATKAAATTTTGGGTTKTTPTGTTTPVPGSTAGATTPSTANPGIAGFTKCSFKPNAKATGGTQPNEIQDCFRDILTFMFVVGIFLIIVRIGISAFDNLNPLSSGKSIEKSVSLVSDVTIGLILIGAPSLFIALFNPAALNLDFLDPTYWGKLSIGNSGTVSNTTGATGGNGATTNNTNGGGGEEDGGTNTTNGNGTNTDGGFGNNNTNGGTTTVGSNNLTIGGVSGSNIDDLISSCNAGDNDSCNQLDNALNIINQARQNGANDDLSKQIKDPENSELIAKIEDAVKNRKVIENNDTRNSPSQQSKNLAGINNDNVQDILSTCREYKGGEACSSIPLIATLTDSCLIAQPNTSLKRMCDLIAQDADLSALRDKVTQAYKSNSDLSQIPPPNSVGNIDPNILANLEKCNTKEACANLAVLGNACLNQTTGTIMLECLLFPKQFTADKIPTNTAGAETRYAYIADAFVLPPSITVAGIRQGLPGSNTVIGEDGIPRYYVGISPKSNLEAGARFTIMLTGKSCEQSEILKSDGYGGFIPNPGDFAGRVNPIGCTVTIVNT